MKRSSVFLLFGVVICAGGMSNNGCGVDPDDLLSLRPAPAILSLTPNTNTRVRNFEVDLRDYPDAASIAWDFGDGASRPSKAIAESRKISHEFDSDGVFNVTVHLFSAPDVINGTGSRLLATGRLPVEVIGPNSGPIAAFVVQDVPDATSDLTRRFIATSSRDPDGTIVSFDWNFGDGTMDSGQSIDHEFPFSGRFPVKLTVTDNDGQTASVSQTVLVNNLPVANFTFTEDPNNALRFTFDATGSTDDDSITEFEWDFGDESTGSGQVVNHTFAVPDDYTVRLTITDSLGATATTTRVVDVTGSEPFVRSIDPENGEVDTIVTDAVIDGENFQTGATVRLERNGEIINGSDVDVQDETTIQVTFDLSDATLGDYTLVVTNPDNSTASRTDAFRVVTPNLVRLVTSEGDIVFDLLRDDAPITTDNFLQYVEDKFYDGTIFHRVVPNFVVQGGGFLPGMVEQTPERDPILNEFSPDRSNLRGTVAMAKLPDNPNSATSEFFVNLKDNSSNLDNQNGGFTVFANVVQGMDVVDAIAGVPLSGETPVEDVILIEARRE